MSRFRIYAASGLFLALTLIKIASPATVTALKARIQPENAREYDYKAAVTALGRAIAQADGNVVQALGRLYHRENGDNARAHIVCSPGYAPVSIEALMRDESLLLSPEALAVKQAALELLEPPEAEPDAPDGPEQEQEQEQETAAEPSEEPVSAEEPAAEPEAVTVFKQSQEAFAGYDDPANVTYDMPALPVQYIRPAQGPASGFGYRNHPIKNVVKFHYGTDIAANMGSDIVAFADGTVTAAGDSDSYGLYLIVTHADGLRTLYAHCSQLLVTEGQSVSAGERIALVGDTGLATGPHLHFELMQNGVYLNPEYYLGAA